MAEVRESSPPCPPDGMRKPPVLYEGVKGDTMAISYTPHINSTTTTYPNYNFVNPVQNGVLLMFVNSEQEALNYPNPTNGCAFYLDGENLILYVKYADGRAMEVYDMKLREAPKQPQYLTAEELNDILDRKLDDLSKKFVLRKDRGSQNG